MNAPQNILNVWHRFDSFPMETITKAWCLKNIKDPKQRSINEIYEHRLIYGASGNCFDLAFCLMDEFRKSNISAYYIGEGLGTTEAHVGVVALGLSGERFLCDLGDLWIQPVNLEATISNQSGFFTGAHISLEVINDKAKIKYLRKNGKKSEQEYNLKVVSEKDFLEAANFSQRNLSDLLIEMRIYNPEEVIHWEFEKNKSFFSTLAGLKEDATSLSKEDWSKRIEKMTNIKADYVLDCFLAYEELLKK
jgi:hypothetical protein